MKEKLPPFQRPEPVIVGPASPEKKQELKETILRHFGEDHCEQVPEDKKILESLEYPKNLTKEGLLS